MEIIDISMPIREDMAVYHNNDAKRPRRTWESRMPKDSVTESRLSIGMHTGTHIDASLHMVEGGGTVEALPLEKLVTPCRVLDLTRVQGGITRADLEPHNIQSGEFLVFRTRNSWDEQFREDFIYLTHEGALYLADIGIKGVGTDALGIERSQPGHETHTTLMGAGIMIVEGLRLKHVEPGEYTLAALPLLIEGAEGAPARAVLIRGLS
ncbi:MAG TPA: cyclase family protein [Candidatus Limnocylindria bacterium]|nr:cyclase family protein [Candidatus Limnocylindria bacterium]